MNDIFSNSLVTKYEILQTTILGSILFIIYIYTLLNLKINGFITSYADDIVILAKAKNEN